MIQADVLDALLPVLAALDEVGAPYYVGGSVCSSVQGIPRATIDVDVVADLRACYGSSLVEKLTDSYYIDGTMIGEAISKGTSFNLIHLATMIKIDVFVLKSEPFHQSAFARRQLHPLGIGDVFEDVPMASPEDIILHKLLWYRMGGMVSERQWSDVLGVLKVQRDALEIEYLVRWAAALGLTELLSSSFQDAGMEER